MPVFMMLMPAAAVRPVRMFSVRMAALAVFHLRLDLSGFRLHGRKHLVKAVFVGLQHKRLLHELHRHRLHAVELLQCVLELCSTVGAVKIFDMIALFHGFLRMCIFFAVFHLRLNLSGFRLHGRKHLVKAVFVGLQHKRLLHELHRHRLHAVELLQCVLELCSTVGAVKIFDVIALFHSLSSSFSSS